MSFFFEKNRVKQEGEIDKALNAHKDTSQYETGQVARSPYNLDNNNDVIKSLNIKDQQDAFYSVYNRGDKQEMQAYNEMLVKKLDLHSKAVEDEIRMAKINATYLNPFTPFMDCLKYSEYGKIPLSLLLAPVTPVVGAVTTMSSGIKILKDKIQLRRTEKAKNISDGVLAI